MKKEISKDQLDDILDILGLDEESAEKYLNDSEKDAEVVESMHPEWVHNKAIEKEIEEKCLKDIEKGVKVEDDETEPSFIGVCYFSADDSATYSKITSVYLKGMHPEWVHDYVKYPDEKRNIYGVTLVFNNKEDLKKFLKNPEIDPATLDVISVRPIDAKDCELLDLADKDIKNTKKPEETLDRSIKPEYYNKGKEDLISFLEDHNSQEEFKGFMVGNAMKYLTRLGKKDNELQDLDKAIEYLKRYRKYLTDNQ